MKNKTVSIIIPSYNEEKYLPGCLDSIFNLNYPKENIEVIVVDNGSTDRTRDIARSYTGVKVLRDHLKNVSGLRNLGASHSSGDILAFVDADCIVSKEWLKKAAKYSDVMDVVAWGAPPTLPETTTWVQRTWFLVREKEYPVQNVDWLETMNLFVRKTSFFDVNGFNEDLVTCEDVDFCFRISKYGRIISDNTIAVIHLGEARSIREFIKKEIWRGQGNLKGIFSHGFSLKEIPSLLIPFYYGFFLPLIFVAFIVLLNPIWLFAFLIFYLLPTAAVLYKVRRKKINSLGIIRLLFLVQIYFLSRTVAAFKKS